MIRVEQLHLRAGAFEVKDVSFEIPTGEYAVLMGKTGCGKTSILEAICGLRRVQGGHIHLCGREVTQLEPASRGIGYVPQDRALFQTMTVRDNLAFSLVIKRWDRAAIAQRVEELADLLGVTHLLSRLPHGLSGGESQRVALGRAMASRPGILCMDEPLSALDDDTREEMYVLLQSLRQRAGVTTLHVTHHQGEADRLADRVLRFADGKIHVSRNEGARRE